MKRKFLVGSFLLVFVLPSFVLAQGQNPPTGSGSNPSQYQPVTGGTPLKNPLKYDTIPEFLAAVLKVIAEIALPILVLFLVYIGFLFVTAQGNPEDLNRAKRYFLWAIIGALIILGASVLSAVIQDTVKKIQGSSDIIHFV
ncbi:hypothetical protein A3D66_03165 [Candidatus Kaiserbacteria bacterium RIFCSPHIGHO2_02_FULL_50_9]|uniref:Uncharacterized protein n=1 Tax=Candidatus Kaiserbacteria bacterium RIFCSPLOWO2_01_FULL_51_21 TaxID=1798508 RepID=A0A1F6ECI2_9BACT|nr:MAG: hypothetical protein A2761_00010 [Candidatus Kaiserbacteria bacterium RIFCSPHIGHO2_01_FULL_51_33]OGG63736.1 MAG: hypothetical protein A3D66_03165 [Candidatus Kaiserbacteria bacterium RIFCSPHIGHO2_02_FULL_50_9]OGG71361.1 MAG: hypothetical protein A3A35_03040 [Candidatus Kaiserbacteria bacterium RIFCSPLOWO2_01_FULL_51_21]